MGLLSKKKAKPKRSKAAKKKSTGRRRKATPAQLRALAKGRKIRAANLKKKKRRR